MEDSLYTYKASLIRVVDGDTIIAMVDLGFNTWTNCTIRLYGIDAPESRTKDKDEKTKGLASKQRLVNILKENKNEFIIRSKGLDKYGRCLGEIFVNTLGDISVSKTLINEGLAKEYFGGKKE
jgi:endonuclease YncB( thermonuclease family)